jgi:hypothetical protein
LNLKALALMAALIPLASSAAAAAGFIPPSDSARLYAPDQLKTFLASYNDQMRGIIKNAGIEVVR